MRIVFCTGVASFFLMVGCAHMGQPPLLPERRAEFDPFFSLVEDALRVPEVSCEALGLRDSVDAKCESVGPLISDVRVIHIIGGPRTRVIVSISSEYCVPREDVVRELWGNLQMELRGGLSSDGLEGIVSEAYVDSTGTRRLVLDIDPYTDSMCIRSLSITRSRGS